MLIELPRGFEQLTRPRPQVAGRRRDWYSISNKADEPAEVYIYDEIGYFGLTAADFVKDLQAIKASQINLHLNTPGGDVFDGIAIHNALRAHSASVAVQVDSLAASIGSVIAMAGDTITMAKHSTMMIHDPFGFAMGNAADMQKMAEILDLLGDTIAGIYAERAGGSVREWRDRMLDETWLTDREAVDIGLADRVDGDAEATAENAFDLSQFRNVPERLQVAATVKPPPTKRTIEAALRDAGLTRDQAKAFIARAWETPGDDEARDASELVALRDYLKTFVGVPQ